MHLRLGGAPASPSPTSPKKSEPERVCDSCFNRLTFECFQWQQTMNRVRREQERFEQRLQEERARQQSERRTSPLPPGKRGDQNARDNMSEAMRALEERGERLQQVADKSEQMKEAASEFHSMAKQLARQQQAKSGLW